MILLHAGLIDGRLYLWGETPRDEAKGAPRPSRRSSRRAAPSQYPYDAGKAGLQAACAAVERLAAVGRRAPVDLIIHLPVLAGAPIASSPIIAEPPVARAAPTLHAFTVTALELLPDEAVALMETAIDSETLAPGVIVAATLRFWAEAFGLAVRLVLRGQFLPGLIEDEEGYQACWEPVLMGDAARRAASLAARMPDACGALTIADGGSAVGDPPLVTPSALLGEFLQMTVDALVLGALAVEEDERSRADDRRRRRRPAHAWGNSGGVDAKWLNALCDATGSISITQDDALSLYARLTEWKRPLLATLSSPYRLCFRLEEPYADVPEGQMEPHAMPDGAPVDPPADGETWYVRYLLQSLDDPSLLIDVASLWGPDGGRRALPAAGNPREYLLTALGQASRLLPEIESSLRAPAPAGYRLDAAGAYEFLQGSAWLLEGAGFGVLLPAWWTRRGTKRRLTARAVVETPKLTAKAGLTMDVVATVDWEIALGEDRLSLDDLKRLARLKAPLVRMRGEWVELNPEEIESALEYWKHGTHRTRMTMRDVVRMALGAASALPGISFGGIEASGPVRRMLERLESGEPPRALPVPEGFHGTLRPYQERGYSWLAFMGSLGFGACLADDMGLGKTVQTLALLLADWEAGAKGPSLLVCPTSVMGNWRKEAERFTPELPVMMHHGVARNKDDAFIGEAERSALVVTSFPLLHRDAEVLGRVAWNGVILDEAQNIKNPETRQARAALSLSAGFRIALTGTPVENHVGDLWSIMEFLNPGFLGSRAAFRRDFFLPIQAGEDAAATEALKRLTGPFILRRLKTDRTIINDLPEKQEMRVYCMLTREQASLYKAVVDEMTGALDDLEGIERRGAVLAGLSKLKQVCNHPAQFLGDNSATTGRSGKLDRLTEMLEEALSEGDRALVFTQFAEMGAIIKRHLQETFGTEALFLHGGTPTKQRDRMVERFQGSDDAPSIFILSLKAGGSGLNLTAASHVFHFDRWWNPAVENQATDRAFRIGQKRNVQVHKFICAGTVEERIDEMIERKQEIAANIVGGGEGWLTTLSTAELRRMLVLRADALGE